MMKILYSISKVLISFGLLLILSCNQEQAPSLYDLPQGEAAAPIINSVDPPNSALAAVSIITINGENFNPNPSYNFVYFNGTLGSVISASSTKLTVKTPNVVADTVKIKIATYKSVDFSNIVLYKLDPVIIEYFHFDPKLDQVPYGIYAAEGGIVYVSMLSKGINEIIPGIEENTLVNFAPSTISSSFRAITLASDGAIYAAKPARGVYQIVENSQGAVFLSSANGITDNVNDVEFDATRNVIWGGGSSGKLYRITLDKNVKKFNITGGVNALRVAGNDLFAATTSNKQEIVWKTPIINADSLGVPEEYFNFSSSVNPTLKIMDLVISADGDLYIGTNGIPDPIYTVHPDKTFETLYPGVINPNSSVYSLSWGSSQYLYMSDVFKTNAPDVYEDSTVYRIDMQKLGAN